MLEWETVEGICRAVASHPLSEVFKVLAEELRKVMDFDRISIAVLEEGEEPLLCFVETSSPVIALPKGMRVPLKGSHLGTSVETGAPVIVEDTLEGKTETDELLIKEGIRSALIFPLLYQGKAIGTLNLGSKKVKNFSEGQLPLLHQLSHALSIAVENTRLLERVKASEERYKEFYDSVPDVYISIDTKGHIQECNRRGLEILGYSKEELLGRSIFDFVSDASLDLARDFIHELLSGVPPEEVEPQLVRKDGSLLHTSLKGSVVREGKGEVVGARVIFEDITLRKKMELELQKYTSRLEEITAERTRELKQTIATLRSTQLSMLTKLALTAEKRDPETRAHLERVRRYCIVLAQEPGLMERYPGMINEKFIQDLFESSPLHDIGKVGVPDTILLKTGRLTEEEFEIMRRHTIIGGEILEGVTLLETARDIALSHHEKWDGSGYPHGLKGEAIPLSARIVAVADVFDALTSKRPYKEALPAHEAAKIIEKGSGSAFDPDVVGVFLKRLDEFLLIMKEFPQV